jgi:hypothetical protein
MIINSNRSNWIYRILEVKSCMVESLRANYVHFPIPESGIPNQVRISEKQSG